MEWKIGTAFQGKGYAVEAARAVLEYLIREVGFHRIEAKCCTENIASERVMQKLGMNKEGILRERFYGKDGRWHDLMEYSLLAHDLSRKGARRYGKKSCINALFILLCFLQKLFRRRAEQLGQRHQIRGAGIGRASFP